MNSFYFFEAEANYKDEILESFNKKSFKGQKIVTGEAEPHNGPGKKNKEKDFKKKDFNKKDFTKKDFKKKDFKKKDPKKKKKENPGKEKRRG
jgi:hypothetical protein